MTRMSAIGRVVTGAVVMTLAASCAAPAPSPTAAPTAPDGLDPDHVLVSIEDLSGWPGFEGTYDPRVASLMADGTLITSDPARNALLTTTSATLDPSELDAAWASVVGRGLAIDRTLELPGLFDASTTAIRTDDGTRSTTLSIYALGGGPTEGTFPPEEDLLRRNAEAAIAELRSVAGAEPWTPPALLLWWNHYAEAPSGLQPRLVAWTPPVDLASAGAPVDTPVYERCARLEGDQAAAVADLARTLPGDVVVEQDGTRYSFVVRPIYPDELGEVDCP